VSDKLFASCCLGSPTQHAEWEPCPLDHGEIVQTEANIFAAYLLMPEHLLSPWLAKHPIQLEDDNWLDRCARTFKVPRALVCFRLALSHGEG